MRRIQFTKLVCLLVGISFLAAKAVTVRADDDTQIDTDHLIDVLRQRASETKYLSFQLSGTVTIAKGAYPNEDPMTGEPRGLPQPTRERNEPWEHSLEILPWDGQVIRHDAFVSFNLDKGSFNASRETTYISGSNLDIESFDTRSEAEKSSAEGPFIRYRLNGNSQFVAPDLFGVEYCLLAAFGHLLKGGYSRYAIEESIWPASVGATLEENEDSGNVLLRIEDDKGFGNLLTTTTLECDPKNNLRLIQYRVLAAGKNSVAVRLNYGSQDGSLTPVSGEFQKFDFDGKEVLWKGEFKIDDFEVSSKKKDLASMAKPSPGDWCFHVPTSRVYQHESEGRDYFFIVVLAMVTGILVVATALVRRRFSSHKSV